MKTLQYLLQHFPSIAKIIVKYESITKSQNYFKKYCKKIKSLAKSIAKSIVLFYTADFFFKLCYFLLNFD